MNVHTTAQAALDLAALSDHPPWVAWQTEKREPGKPPTKVPYSPVSGAKARADDPSTWGSRAQAEARAAQLPKSHGIGGVGIQLGDLGDGRSIGGIDLDTCRDESGKLAAWASEIIDRLGTYAEVSRSGRGAKLFFTYATADIIELRAAMGTGYGKMFKAESGEHPPAIELHLGNRYFALTGEHLAGTPLILEPISANTLLWIIHEAGPRFAASGSRAGSHESIGGSDRADELTARIDSAATFSSSLARFWAGDWSGLNDQSRSARAFALGKALQRVGFTFFEMCDALALCPDTAEWKREKGDANGGRELRRIWEASGECATEALRDADLLAHPDMNVLRLHRRPPPALPFEAFGPAWGKWIPLVANAAACPPDYVAAPLLAAASALIGNARWAQAVPGWAEPPHLWTAAVGDSGQGKSPGADALMRDVLPEIERRMVADFPDKLRDWRAASEAHQAGVERWKADVREAAKLGNPAPLPPVGEAPPEPQAPRLRQTDVTIERVATLLANAAPKGVLIVRDELAGWLSGMNAYNDAGRAFWIESYGGRPYRVERQKNPQPIEVQHLAVAVFGGTQPEKLAALMREADDGLLARFCWFWPDPVPFQLAHSAPNTGWATEALDQLRLLDLVPGTEPDQPARPRMVPLVESARADLEAFGRDMQDRQQSAGGLMRSAYGKARGLALRLSLVLEYLWWCAEAGMAPPPAMISQAAFLAAARLVSDYLMPMAERVYGDAAARTEDRNAATLARWLIKNHPTEVHVRHLQREVRLPDVGTAEAIHAAARVLVEAGWLLPPETSGVPGRPKAAYRVNPRLWETKP
jgi:hypothetical protein